MDTEVADIVEVVEFHPPPHHHIGLDRNLTASDEINATSKVATRAKEADRLPHVARAPTMEAAGVAGPFHPVQQVESHRATTATKVARRATNHSTTLQQA